MSDNEGDASLPTFRPFTRFKNKGNNPKVNIKYRDEFAIIENRILEKKMAEAKKEELRKKNLAVRIV